VKPPETIALWVSGFLTITSTVPGAWAGVVARSCVALLKTTAAGVCPKVTVAPLWKSVPVMVTTVPPTTGPEFGKTLLMVGGGPPLGGAAPSNVKAPSKVSDLVSGFVTLTSTLPGSCTGVTASMLVEVTELILAAGTSPNTTLAPFWMSVPVMATVVPPVVGPEAGEMPVSFGGVMAFSQLLLLAEPAPPPQATRKLIKVRHAAATPEVLSIPSLLSTGMFIDTLLACPDPIVHPLAAYQTPAIGLSHVLETRHARGFTSPETFSPSKRQVNLPGTSPLAYPKPTSVANGKAPTTYCPKTPGRSL
jgi:hypothetical protein